MDEVFLGSVTAAVLWIHSKPLHSVSRMMLLHECNSDGQ
jgi:hypothetical protein